MVVAIHHPLQTGMDQPALMGAASQRSSKVGFFPTLDLSFFCHFRPSILSLHEFPLCMFYIMWARAGTATLHHWEHGCPRHSLPSLHQAVPSTGNQSQADTQTSSRTHHQLWPYLGLERRVEVAPHLRGDQRAAACMDSLALVTPHHHTAGWHRNGVFRWGPQCAVRFCGREVFV